MNTKHDGTTIIETRSTRRLAEAYVKRFADVQGDQQWWDGQRFHPIFVEWTVERGEGGRWNIVQTITTPVEEEPTDLLEALANSIGTTVDDAVEAYRAEVEERAGRTVERVRSSYPGVPDRFEVRKGGVLQ